MPCTHRLRAYELRPAATSGAACSPRADSPRCRGGARDADRGHRRARRDDSRPTSWRRLRRLADELDVPLSSVLLAAHAKVLSALSGERHVATGYVAGTGRPLPCPLTTEAESWRELLLDTHRVEAQLLSHADFPLDELRRELGLTEPAFETVFDPTGADGDLGEDTVLRLGIAQRGDVLVLRLRYRTDVLDADCAARIAGYHLTALELIAADLDAEHRRQSLLSAEEAPLPARRAGWAAACSCRIAGCMSCSSSGWRRILIASRPCAATGSLTYGQLNARANRLARALLARGLGREGVVAVVAERNLDWLAAVLAVFKAGGVYLPIEPHFPADRIASDAVPGRLPAGADRTRQHCHAGPGPDVAARGPEAVHRAGLRRGSCRRQSRRRGRAGSARLYLFHVWFDW